MKILCGIMGCNLHAALGYHQAIRETWGSEFFGDLRFFVGRGADELPSDTVRLDVPDDKEVLLHKVTAIMRWALDNGYDAIFKVNTNTYVNVPVLCERHHEGLDYAGAVVGRLGEVYPGTGAKSFIQGCSSWLSARAMRLLVNDVVPYAVREMPRFMEWNGRIAPYLHSEDLWIGQVLHAHLPRLNWCADQGYGNGPITFWSQSNFVKLHCLSTWMHAMHDAHHDVDRMQEIAKEFRSRDPEWLKGMYGDLR